MDSLGQRVLGRALEKLGTPEQLARALHIPKPALAEYMEGRSPVPEAVLLRAVDIITEDSVRVTPSAVARPTKPPVDG